MDEEVINDLYSRAKSKGYQKSRDEFVNLLHKDSDVLKDMYSYVKDKGYNKDINSFESLIGKNQAKPVSPVQKKKFALESSSEDGSLVSQRSPKQTSAKMATLTQSGFEDAMQRQKSVPTDMSGNPLIKPEEPKKRRTESKPPTEEDYFTGSFGKVLRGFDEIVPLGIGDFADDMARSVASGYRQGEVAQSANDLLLQGHKSTPEQIQKFIDANKSAQQLKPSAEMQDYNRIYEKEGKGFWGVIKGLANNPSVIPEVLSSSLVSMATNTDALKAGGTAIGAGALRGAVVGAGVTPEFAGAGAIPGAVTGAASAVPYAFGLASSVVEAGATFGELLQDELKGKDLTKENVKDILEDPNKLNSIRNKAIARGLIIGTVDALTGKLASGVGAKILSRSAAKSAVGEAAKSAVVKATAAGSAIESLGGSTGEAVARAATGQDMDVSEIALEGLAELPGGVRSTIQARLAKPSYKVNGSKVEAKDLDELIETMTPTELASTKIDIKNDYEGREFKIRDKVLTYSIAEEVKKANPDLNEPSLNAIVELEKSLKSLEGNNTQTGKDKAASLRQQIKNIQENQLEEEAVIETAQAETKPLETLNIEPNAIQEQSTTEVPVQSETITSETLAPGVSESGPEVVTEQATQEEVTAPQTIIEEKADVVKVKKSDDFMNDAEHIITLNGEDVGRMYYDRSSKAWRDPNFDRSKYSSESFERVYGDILGDTKQEATDELIKRVKESTKQEAPAKEAVVEETVTEEPQGVEFTKDTVLNKFLNKLNSLNPIQRNPIDNKSFIYGDKASLEFNRFDKGDRNEVSLEGIASLDKGKGLGKETMTDITNSADELGTTLTLEAKPFGREGLSKEDLINFYKKNGFEVDQQYLEDLEFDSEQEAIDYVLENDSEALPMVRVPKVSNVNNLLSLDTKDKAVLNKVLDYLNSIDEALNLDPNELNDVTRVMAVATAKAIVKTLKALVNGGITLQEAIRRASEENNVKPEQIIDALDIVSKINQNVSEGISEIEAPGYNQLSKDIDNMIANDLDVNEALNSVKDSDVYKNATDVQKELLVRDVRKRFGLRQKQAPSVGKLFGTIKNVKKITMREKDLLIKQIKDKAKGAKDVIKTQKEFAKELADEIKELSKKGKITLTQAANIVSKFSKVNLLNEVSVANFVDYMTKVFADAEYDNKINIAKGKLKNAKKNIATKIGMADGLVLPLQKLFSINPTLIPEQYLNRYLELVDMFGERKEVLSLEEKSKVTEDVQEILDEINNEQSLSDELSDRFDASENKVFKDGVLDFSASVKNMLEEGEIDSKEADLMSKYKSRIVDSIDRAKMTEEEIQKEKDALVSIIKKSTIEPSGLSTRDEISLAKRLSRLIKGDGIKDLTNTELKNVLKLIDNINNGYLPHYTQLMVEKLTSINNAKSLESSVKKSSYPTFTYMYSKIKSIFTKKDEVFEMIRRNPLFYIDQVLGNFKTKDIFNSVLEMAAEGESKFTSEFKSIKERLTKAQDDVAKSFTLKDKLNPNKILESSFKMMTYAIQLEYESNKDSKQVNPASEFIKATIKHINDGKSQFGERDVEALQKILDEYTTDGEIDIDKLYKSFNNAEKNAIKTVREINESLTEKSEYTASVIRGQKINPLTNYIHLNVLHEHQPNDLASGTSFADNYNNSLRPSTKAKSLIERTGKVSPLNFDIFSSAERGAKFVLMDYHLTEPIRTARKTINRTISNLEKDGEMSKKDRKVVNAINNAFEESVENLVSNTYVDTSIADDVVDEISRQGYRGVLAGTGRFGAELLSNVGFILISDPDTFTEGLKNISMIMSPDAPKVMNNVNSKETNRIFPSDMLSGRLIDTSILSQSIGTKGSESKNPFVNRVQQIWNLTGKKYKNAVELTADVLISTPDKVVMRPIWFGSFANQFEKMTGKKVDFKKIADNDTDYMEENREAIDKAKNIADERSVITGASSNAFTGILKGSSKPNQSATIKAFNNFNNFMSKFLIYEYVTARTGIYAAMGNGSLTKKQGVALLAAVTTRMTVYSLLMKAFGSGLIGLLFDDDEEEKEKSTDKMVNQALASTFTSLLLGRDFGNLTKGFINYGVEKMNEKYLDFLREGDYDPYKDALQYSVITPDDKKKDISDFVLKMGGSFGPVLNTADLVLKKSFEPKKKERDAILRQRKEISTRIPLEIGGNAGFIPFYKDIRKIVLKDMYKDLEKGEAKVKIIKRT